MKSFWRESKTGTSRKEQCHKIPYPTLQGTDYIFTNLLQTKQKLVDYFRNCSDIVFRDFEIFNGKKALAVFIDGLVDTKHFEEAVIKPLMLGNTSEIRADSVSSTGWIEQFVIATQTKRVRIIQEFINHVLKGDVGILIDGETEAIITSIKGWQHRSIEEPASETVVRGPREGFVENLRTNTALLRRKIRSPNFKLESLTLGKVTQTKVVIAYIEGIVTPYVVDEVRKRLQRIVIDGILESGYIEELIEDHPYSPFPQVLHTERPDVVVAHLLEGRVGILVNGTPFVLIVPMTFWAAMQVSEDHYDRFMIATALRWLRILFMVMALLFPSLYVAITTFHQEMLPTNLLLSVAAAREASPFPAFVEALIMEVTFEALREAGVRLPRQVGQAVSIVGALVIGQAAVQAGIVSAPMVIVVSITGIASFTIAHFNLAIAIRMLRFPMIFLAGTLGLYGVVIGTLAIMIHLVQLRSLGIPYFDPLAPLSIGGLKDTLVRVPRWMMQLRPRLTGYIIRDAWSAV
ncbi:spore germination protein [Collibacillus ludicampi]|uniref:Spore germination protein n=1 Tax=Collibacillus ludicampi TaxID=2771369 RepID=A0AAV4LHD2_9BACL|nr:spore germination protein [Collibacillus ludicampi]GIM47133.1 spore germination protein [Collibacillus ludicampi]